MSYYRGDGGNYYRGDYYRGDPFLGRIAWAAAKKFAPRAVAAVGRFGKRILGSRRAQRVMDVGTGIGIGGLAEAGRSAGWPQRQGTPRQLPNPDTGWGSDSDVEAAWAAGWRPINKYRKMNPLNPRALRRALRRAEGFEKFAARTVNSLYRVIDGRRVRTFKKKRTA